MACATTSIYLAKKRRPVDIVLWLIRRSLKTIWNFEVIRIVPNLSNLEPCNKVAKQSWLMADNIWRKKYTILTLVDFVLVCVYALVFICRILAGLMLSYVVQCRLHSIEMRLKRI